MTQPATAFRQDVLAEAAGWLDEGRRVALATVIATWGSSPRPVGSPLAVQGSQAEPLIVVTGHEHDRIEAALAGRNLALARNPDHATGLSSSLRRGMAALWSAE